MNVGNALIVTYAKYGKCFRIGGDEFCVILTKRINQAEEINMDFLNRIEQYKIKDQRMPHVSLGYVYFNPYNDSFHDAIQDADLMMYQTKERRRGDSSVADSSDRC